MVIRPSNDSDIVIPVFKKISLTLIGYVSNSHNLVGKTMITDEIYKNYQSAILVGDRSTCSTIVNNLLENKIDMKTLYIQLFQRSLYEVGVLWENNQISVAIEHLCTTITESLINLAYPYLFNSPHNGCKAVIICTPGEYHQVGARMVADYFELNGWDGYFLGRETPGKDLDLFIHENSPDLLAISMSIYFNLNLLIKLIDDFTSKFPKLNIIVGGQGFNSGNEELLNQYSNVKLIYSLDELDEKIFKKHQC